MCYEEITHAKKSLYTENTNLTGLGGQSRKVYNISDQREWKKTLHIDMHIGDQSMITSRYHYIKCKYLLCQIQVESSEPVYEPLTADPSTEEGLSIADQIRSAAEQAINQSDYVFDEASGMYYDQQTGYYYNPV